MLNKNIILFVKITVDDQIKHLLRDFKEYHLNAEGEFYADSQMLMRFYNNHVVEKDPSVTFGNVMSIMRKKGIILPPNPIQSKIVMFCRERGSIFLHANGCRCILFMKYLVS